MTVESTTNEGIIPAVQPRYFEMMASDITTVISFIASRIQCPSHEHACQFDTNFGNVTIKTTLFKTAEKTERFEKRFGMGIVPLTAQELAKTKLSIDRIRTTVGLSDEQISEFELPNDQDRVYVPVFGDYPVKIEGVKATSLMSVVWNQKNHNSGEFKQKVKELMLHYNKMFHENHFVLFPHLCGEVMKFRDVIPK